jgi:hypothetical protein
MGLLFHWNKEELKKLFVISLKYKTGEFVDYHQIGCLLEMLLSLLSH